VLQALKREADLVKRLTEAKGQAEAAEKKLALAEANVRNSGSLRKLQMRHVSIATLSDSCLCLSTSQLDKHGSLEFAGHVRHASLCCHLQRYQSQLCL